ncbi:MAG: DNA lyase [Spirochaetaceae bacterium]|nr:DNA lyase [Spirochaetaceae bacterium]
MKFELENTLFCGQSFSWRKCDDGNFKAVLENKIHCVIEGQSEFDPFMTHYLDNEFDYNGTLQEITKLDPILNSAIKECGEIHILNQDLWETVIGFMLSQNNNIKRIEGLYDKMSKTFGSKIEDGYYSFPRPEQLKNVTEYDLRSLGVGFRAPYLLDAIKRSDDILSVVNLSDEKADKILQDTKGIGPKVSACIRLFGLHNMEVFPKDVWIKRVMSTWFPGKDEDYFKPYQGLSQQYLFLYARTHGFE